MKYIHIKVKAGVRKESFSPRPFGAGQATSDDHFEISVREKAERNMANERVIELVARHFKVLKNKIRIVNGHRSSSKLLIIE